MGTILIWNFQGAGKKIKN